MDDVEENTRALDARMRLPRRNTNWGQRGGGTGANTSTQNHSHSQKIHQQGAKGRGIATQTRTSNHRDRRNASWRQGRRGPSNNHCCKRTPDWHREGREGGPKSSTVAPPPSPESCTKLYSQPPLTCTTRLLNRRLYSFGSIADSPAPSKHMTCRQKQQGARVSRTTECIRAATHSDNHFQSK